MAHTVAINCLDGSNENDIIRLFDEEHGWRPFLIGSPSRADPVDAARQRLQHSKLMMHLVEVGFDPQSKGEHLLENDN